LRFFGTLAARCQQWQRAAMKRRDFLKRLGLVFGAAPFVPLTRVFPVVQPLRSLPAEMFILNEMDKGPSKALLTFIEKVTSDIAHHCYLPPGLIEDPAKLSSS
jgi:hypothetical protein